MTASLLGLPPVDLMTKMLEVIRHSRRWYEILVSIFVHS